MPSPRQYPRAADLALIARLKLVAKLHNRGYSINRIATELDYGRPAATRDVATITDRYREFEDLDKHLRDVQARTGEQLTKLNEQEGILWKQLDWAMEWVVQIDGFGQAIYEYDEEGELKDEPLHGPRKPNMVPQLVNQIQALNKQQAEILGLLNKNVDITMKLQLNERIQITILEAIRQTDGDTYTQIVRQIKAAKAMLDQPELPGGNGRRLTEVIDGEYEEVAAS